LQEIANFMAIFLNDKKKMNQCPKQENNFMEYKILLSILVQNKKQKHDHAQLRYIAAEALFLLADK